MEGGGPNVLYSWILMELLWGPETWFSGEVCKSFAPVFSQGNERSVLPDFYY